MDGVRVVRMVLLVLVFLSFASGLKTSHSAQSANQQSGTGQTIDAHVLFDKHCASCHGKDGEAKTFKPKFNHARNLTDAKWQSDVTDERIFNSIENGKGKMPAFGKKLSQEQVNGLVSYVRHLKK